MTDSPNNGLLQSPPYLKKCHLFLPGGMCFHPGVVKGSRLWLDFYPEGVSKNDKLEGRFHVKSFHKSIPCVRRAISSSTFSLYFKDTTHFCTEKAYGSMLPATGLRPAKLDLSVPTELLEQARWVVQSDWIRFDWIDLPSLTNEQLKVEKIGLNLGKSAPNYQFSGCFAISFRLLDCIGFDGLESQNSFNGDRYSSRTVPLGCHQLGDMKTP